MTCVAIFFDGVDRNPLSEVHVSGSAVRSMRDVAFGSRRLLLPG